MKNILNKITIKQANIYVSIILFVFTVIFVTMLVDEIYQDYKTTLEQNQSQVIDKQKKLKSLLIKTVLSIVTLAFILFGIVLGLYKILNTVLQRDTQIFLDFFNQAAHSNIRMDKDDIFFEDFKTMVGHANEMVDTISKQKKSLRSMNISLEQRVKEKTADLQIINKNLQKEKKFSEDVLKSQKEFLRYTVHETNTPLSVILTSIELYSMNHTKDRQLSKIEAAVKNVFNIYDDLSYLVKKDQVKYPKKVINLGEYLGSRIDFFAEVAELSRLSFEYKIEQKKYFIYFNETKLQRIVDNTLTNAIKYTMANEEIYVKLKYFGSFIDFEVSSRSKIIKDTDKVFDAYYREEKQADGFGLGLKLVRSICDEEGVEIFVNSDTEKTSFRYRIALMGD